MSGRRSLLAARLMSLAGFLTLLVCTYWLRSEVLALSHLRFSADEVRAAYDLQQLKDSYADRVNHYQAEVQNYELQREHYREMLDLYRTDYDAYVQRIEDKYVPPSLPRAPSKPTPPEISEQLYEINTNFRIRKNRYFELTSRLNWVACVAALMLVGGLLWLLMFDMDGQRWLYLAALVLSFVFLIGPAFHSILSGIIGFLEEPRVY
ncbi:MAG: hypothetical protein ACF8TS_15810 [Maioricimonas sp. JB049]